MSCWEILQIEKTKDIQTIKHAYACLLKIYHPEEDPIKFKELHDAYESALLYAKGKRNIEIIIKRKDEKEEKTGWNEFEDCDKDDVEEDFFEEEKEPEFFEKLFQEREEEIKEKAIEEGKNFRYKIQYLIDKNEEKDIELWRFTLRRDEFGLALYDESFVEFLYNILYHNFVSIEILFEIYFYFLKYKKEDKINSTDVKFKKFLEKQFV